MRLMLISPAFVLLAVLGGASGEARGPLPDVAGEAGRPGVLAAAQGERDEDDPATPPA